MDAIVHPVTGVLFDADAVPLPELIQVGSDTRAEIGRLYRALDPVEAAMRARQGDYVLPERRYQTETQARVERCPRCRTTHTVESGAA